MRATFVFTATRIAPFSPNLLLSALDPSELTRLLCGMRHKLFGVLRRIGFLVLVVWTVVSLVTLLIELVPGDPAVATLGDQATPEQLAQFRARRIRPEPVEKQVVSNKIKSIAGLTHLRMASKA